MSKLMLSAAACLLTGGCYSTPPVELIRPPPAPVWAMQDCPDWPALPGEGRVPIDAAAQAVRDAQVAHADCKARHEGLQRYVNGVVAPAAPGP